jgi:shikimate dehydrogenase
VTRLVTGVVGDPIGHSLSPVLHTAWLDALGLNADYVRFHAPDAEAFDDLLQQGRDGRLRGLNVTAPYKSLALERAEVVSEAARRCGSANLLIFENGRIFADSTDGRGLLAALAEQAPRLRLEGCKAVVVGAGGAARAAVAALTDAKARVSVLNRTVAKAERLAEELNAEVADDDALGRAELIVNAISVPPQIDVGLLGPGAVLMDMTYRPLITDFLETGRNRGLGTVDGLAMLIGQARPSFEVLFGRAPPPVDVRAAALAAMQEVT